MSHVGILTIEDLFVHEHFILFDYLTPDVHVYFIRGVCWCGILETMTTRIK